MRTTPYLLRLVCLLLASASLAAERDNAKYTPEADAAAKQFAQQIKAEVESLGNHPWAGEYYHGDGLGVNVTFMLAPQSGFLFEWHGCLGLYDRNYGEIACTNGMVTLSFTFSNERRGFQGIADAFIPVPWGDRMYLIPSDDIIGFCNDFNARSEPRNLVRGSHLLRRGDEKKNIEGFPAVPEQYRPYLLEKPIEAAVTAVGSYTTRPSVCEWKFKDTSVTLDKGKEAGLLPGMELYVVEPNNLVESIRVTHVEDHSAQGVMTEIGEDKPGPNAGWKLSTRPRWRK